MIQVGQILFILSVLVILHEFGHYITARMFKVRVEKFYLFMDAGFSLLKKKIGDTEWGIGWLPIGGYVKLAGMVDESMDMEQMKQEPQPWEFRSKPAWQRLIIMLGGIIVNILLAWFLYTVVYTTYGQKYVSTEKIQKNGLSFGETGLHAGFQNGDRILSVDGVHQARFNRLVLDALLGDNIEIERNGEKKTIVLTDEHKAEILSKEGRGFVGARNQLSQVIIDSVTPVKNKPSVFMAGDQIKAFGNKSFFYFDQLTDELKKHKNQTVQLTVLRNETPVTLALPVDKDGNVGFGETVFFGPSLEMTDSFVNEVVSGSEAEKAKVQKNDIITGFDNKEFKQFSEFKSELKKSADKDITLNIIRDSKKMALPAHVGSDGKLGFGLASKNQPSYEIVNKLSLGEAFPEAVKESWQLLIYNVKQFKLILRPKTEAYKHVKSPVGIARALPDTWNWEFIWNFTALFSIGLAFMNLLPIPGLDGGHALFTIAEMITGKTLSEKAMGHVQTAGMIILLTLMALTFGNDIYQLVVDKLL
ncbi:putative membrane-associated zinc metalloprotease [Flavobacterium limnosediminis JC2902]|uniref:Putative membrane-associated zinc metalloprotease n=1 Tax=Flavobacterium limnosediminis JC2902 TaxID=1341181 RepID=V6SRJ5_9FLAO|nr:site-2 protease family protein [Flavobacterium limnosediminis]ESU29079.1 putative membrane-associated zinc metalloprotease [Flavobacterium limnosediminis JC2902]